MYDIGRSVIKHSHAPHQPMPAEARPSVPSGGAKRVMLFTTKTCPNCKLAAAALQKKGIAYEVIDADENPELVKAFGVKQAPTLIVKDAETVEKISNASNIKKFAEAN